MAQTRIRLTESELKNMIIEAVEEEISNEGWFGRTFGSSQSRGNTQMQDAVKLIQQSDQLIQQFRSAMQAAGTAAQAWNPQQGQQQQVKEAETNEILPLLGLAGAAGALELANKGRNFLGGKGDKNYQLVAQAYKLRSDAYNFIARAISNGVPIDFSTFEDKLLGVTPQKAQAVSGQATQGGQQQGGANGAQATNWNQAEAEINQVVKGNFNGWPQKCRQAGWPEEKIQAYQKMANSVLGGKKKTAAQPAATGTSAAPAAGGTASAAPAAGGNTSSAQPQQQQVTEAVINKVVKNFVNRK